MKHLKRYEDSDSLDINDFKDGSYWHYSNELVNGILKVTIIKCDSNLKKHKYLNEHYYLNFLHIDEKNPDEHLKFIGHDIDRFDLNDIISNDKIIIIPATQQQIELFNIQEDATKFNI